MELFGNIKAFMYMFAAALLAAAVLFYAKNKRSQIINALFDKHNYLRLIPSNLLRNRKLADALFLSGLGFMFIALAMPQWGKEKVEYTANYSQAVIVMDVSNSMLAQDFKPDRLTNAKMMTDMLLSNMANERLGLIAFTSKAVLQCPVTTDYSALKSLNDKMSVDMIAVQGTAFAPAVNLAADMLSAYAGKKAIVLISDGEDHNPKDLDAALKTAKENNVKIISVGIGSAEGELIPEYDKSDTQKSSLKGFKKDKQGQTVMTKLDEKALIALASATGGAYIKYTGAQDTAESVSNQLKTLDKSSSQGGQKVKYKNRYQIPLFIGILLVLGSILIPLRKVK